MKFGFGGLLRSCCLIGSRGDIAMGKYGKLPCALIDNKMFPSVEVDCGSFVVFCPCCGSQIPCLDIRFIDARDRLSDEVRKRTGVHMPVYQEKCPVCGLDIVYDAGDEGWVMRRSWL